MTIDARVAEQGRAASAFLRWGGRMPDATPPRGAVFDLDGVVRTWDSAVFATAEADHGLPVGELRAAVLDDADLLRAAVTGQLTDRQWRAAVAAGLASRYGSAAARAVEQWSHSAGHVDHEVLAIVREQRRRTPVALLTNATDRLEEDLSRLGLSGEFDHVVNSSQLGAAKPDPAAFLAATAALDAAPTACLYTDDSCANTAAARALGMRAHHYTAPGPLRDFLCLQPLDT